VLSRLFWAELKLKQEVGVSSGFLRPTFARLDFGRVAYLNHTRHFDIITSAFSVHLLLNHDPPPEFPV
jgi:hypothetical protein